MLAWDPGGLMGNTKKCPICAEEIAAAAIKCRFCNERIDGGVVPGRAPPPGAEQYAECPSCKLRFAKLMSYTWWGGVVGPKLLTHVKCENCGTQYNGKTGRSNNTGIAIYTLVGLVLVGGGLILFAIARVK